MNDISTQHPKVVVIGAGSLFLVVSPSGRWFTPLFESGHAGFGRYRRGTALENGNSGGDGR